MKSNDGFILIELLLAVWIVGCIFYLLLILMSNLNEKVNYERATNKVMQVDSLITEDLLNGTKVEVSNECLDINLHKDIVNYCFTNKELVRKVNDQGYERIVDNVDGKFYYSTIIYMHMEVDEHSIEIPIWIK